MPVFFQLPILPEWLARQGNWWLAGQALRRTSRTGTFSDADLVQYRRAWAQPGSNGATAYRSMIHWYRAFVRHRPPLPATIRISVPTLVIWGRHDSTLLSELAQGSIDLCDNGRLIYIDDATHWVQHEAADRVNQLIIDTVRTDLSTR